MNRVEGKLALPGKVDCSDSGFGICVESIMYPDDLSERLSRAFGDEVRRAFVQESDLLLSEWRGEVSLNFHLYGVCYSSEFSVEYNFKEVVADCVEGIVDAGEPESIEVMLEHFRWAVDRLEGAKGGI